LVVDFRPLAFRSSTDILKAEEQSLLKDVGNRLVNAGTPGYF